MEGGLVGAARLECEAVPEGVLPAELGRGGRDETGPSTEGATRKDEDGGQDEECGMQPRGGGGGKVSEGQCSRWNRHWNDGRPEMSKLRFGETEGE